MATKTVEQNAPSKDQPIAATIRQLREESGVSHHILAAKAGIHWNSLAKIERDGRDPNYSTVLALLHGLGYDLKIVRLK